MMRAALVMIQSELNRINRRPGRRRYRMATADTTVTNR